VLARTAALGRMARGMAWIFLGGSRRQYDSTSMTCHVNEIVVAIVKAHQVFVIAAVVVVQSALFREIGIVGAAIAVAIIIRRHVLARAGHFHVRTLRHAFGHDFAVLSIVAAVLKVFPPYGVNAEAILRVHAAVVARRHAGLRRIVGVRESRAAEFDGIEALELSLEVRSILVKGLELGLCIGEQLVRGLVLGFDRLQLGHLGAKRSLGLFVLVVLHLGSVHLLSLRVALGLERSGLQRVGGRVEHGLVLRLRDADTPVSGPANGINTRNRPGLSMRWQGALGPRNGRSDPAGFRPLLAPILHPNRSTRSQQRKSVRAKRTH
jgi:hypothetical protein